MSTGAVEHWDTELGLGSLASPETPGGCWVHWSVMSRQLAQVLSVGDPVMFTWVSVQDQDGFLVRADSVWEPGGSPGAKGHQNVGGAYRALTPDHGHGIDGYAAGRSVSVVCVFS